MSQRGLHPIVLIASFMPMYASAQVVTVTTLEDITDFPSPQLVAQLPGPDGVVSFREALLAANNTPAPQTIRFAIPTSQYWLINDMALLKIEEGAFFYADDGGTLDFSSQTDFAGDTNPNGSEIGIYGLAPNAWGVAAIFVTADGATIRGLGRVLQRGYGLEISGNQNRVIGCTIDGPLYAGVYVTGGFGGLPPTGNIIGGVEEGEGNFLSAGNSGVRIDGPADQTVVVGNTLTGSSSGVAVRSAPDFDMNATNTRIGGPTAAERNFIFGAGRYGEEGFPTGEQVSIEQAFDTLVQGNYIGLLADGVTAASQRGPAGIEVRSSVNTVIRDNVISGIVVNGVNHYAGQRFGAGISIFGDSTNTQVFNNLIGTDASGQNPIPNRVGVLASFWPQEPSPSGTEIGGVAPGQGNVIAFNETAGVSIPGTITGIPIRGNSIHSNGGLGIDLLPLSGGSGVSPNDIGDDDVGGNLLQNFPILSAAESSASTTDVQGSLNSAPNTTYLIDFYASPTCDPSGLGEGRAYLGAAEITTNAAGAASFDVTIPRGSAAGEAITATATDPLGNTSEFGPCVASTVGVGGAVGDLDSDGDIDLGDLSLLLGSYGQCEGGAGFNSAADLDGSGCVDLVDLSMLLTDFGS